VLIEGDHPAEGPRQRDAARTRARIVAAARKEFGRSGYQGARIGAIARAAGVNASLIFYYFENKAGLYRAVAERRMATYAPPSGDQDILEWPAWLFRLAEETQDAMGLVLREGIGAEQTRPPLIEEEARRQSYLAQVERVRRAQQAGLLRADLDPRQTTLLLYILGVYPYMLPQFAHLITGSRATDPAFRERFEAFVRELVAVLLTT
jgi:TetR/AcrR family transcriptional regulator